MTLQQIIETDFNTDLARENKSLQRVLFKEEIVKKTKCANEDIVFISNNSRFDDCFLYKNKKGFVEYKIDYRASVTGNIVFELIPWVEEKELPNISSIRISATDTKIRSEIISLINRMQKGICARAKISIHLDKTINEKYCFFYTISKADASNTKYKYDIYKSIMFNGKKLAKFIQANYTSRDFIITKTRKNDSVWLTISSLISISEAEKVSFY